MITNSKKIKIQLLLLCIFSTLLIIKPAYSNTCFLSGGFIQLNESNARQDAQWWYQQVDNMENIGIDTIVIQYSAYDTISFANVSDNYYSLSSGNNNPLEHILTRADQKGIGVYLGLGLEESFKVSYNAASGQFEFNYLINDIIDRAKRVLDQLYALYGYSQGTGVIHESLVGWYFPTEMNDANVVRSGHQTFTADVVNYYSTLSRYAHNETGLSTMISPYIASDGAFFGNEVRDPQAYANWWDDVLDDDPNVPDDPFIDVDIIAVQDSVGAGHVSIEQSREYFRYLKPVLKRNGVQLWSNNEAFRVVNGNAYTVAPFSQFRSQVHSTAQLVEKTIFFEFTSYMKGPGNALYDDYYNWVSQAGSGINGVGVCSDYILPDRTWQQLSIPADLGSTNTIADVFGNNLPGAELGTNWAVFAFNPASNTYASLSLVDTLQSGVSYWVYQQTGAAVKVDLPAGVQEVQANNHSSQCTSTTGCYEITLPTKANAVQWSLFGNPSQFAIPLGNVRVVTDGGVCADAGGCTLDEASSANIVNSDLFHYNGAAYDSLNSSSSLSAWQGAWLATLTAADGLNPRILIPLP